MIMLAIPVRIVFDNLTEIGGLIGVLLVSNFKTSYLSNLFGLEGNVVFILGFTIRVLYHHIYRLPDIAFLEVNIAHKVGILEDLGWLEVVGKDLM